MATPTSDRVAALFGTIKKNMGKLASAGLLSFILNIAPVPASRPKVSKWGVYYSKTYSKFLRSAQEELSKHNGKPTQGPIVVMMEHIVERPRTGKLELPQGDVDNYAKGPLDAMTKAGTFWWDDEQVALLVASKRYAKDGEKPRTEVHWFPI